MNGFGSYVGQAVELTVDGSGGVRVSKVTAVIDCGVAINPDAIKAQIEGAISQAIGVTLYAQQTFVQGVAQVTNYNKYRFVKLQDMSQVIVQIIANGDKIGGVGEPGIPCMAPAIANAYARLAGTVRRRSLPFFLGSRMGGL
jgi:isoquinoline 1-oxidoreductase beta subunit